MARRPSTGTAGARRSTSSAGRRIRPNLELVPDLAFALAFGLDAPRDRQAPDGARALPLTDDRERAVPPPRPAWSSAARGGRSTL
jgi:hypothetical protein